MSHPPTCHTDPHVTLNHSSPVSTLSSDSSFDDPQAASYEFTTLTCVPGIKYWKGAKIQLLDLPGIIEGAKDGKGRGRQVIGVARTCSCIIIVLDAMKSMEQAQVESKKEQEQDEEEKMSREQSLSHVERLPC